MLCKVGWWMHIRRHARRYLVLRAVLCCFRFAKNKIKYQSTNDYVKEIKKGSPSGEITYKEQQGLMLYTVMVDRDLFMDAMKKTLDAYAFNLSEYAKSKK